MMSAEALLEKLVSRGMRLWVEGATIRWVAPSGLLKDADVAALKALKPELLDLWELDRHRFRGEALEAGPDFGAIPRITTQSIMARSRLPMTLDIISLPKDKAWEYADLALNIYKGCTHRCLYCYCATMKGRHPGEYFKGASPKGGQIVPRLTSDLQKLGPEAPAICMSFMGDVYQPAEMELGLTRLAIKVLTTYGARFTILTKGGMRAARDFDLLEAYPKASFGTTLVFTKEEDAAHWEQGAASIADRVRALHEAKKRGIKTWVSLEPVIDPAQALELIETIWPMVDHWKIGKINHLPEFENQVDWVRFRKEAKELLGSVGADYYMKRSLTDL